VLALERAHHLVVPEPVSIRFLVRAEAWMETGRRLLGGDHPDGAGQVAVEGPHWGVGLELAGDGECRDLAERVDPGVGAPRPGHRHVTSVERPKSVFNLRLDRDAIVLALPADEAR